MSFHMFHCTHSTLSAVTIVTLYSLINNHLILKESAMGYELNSQTDGDSEYANAVKGYVK